MTRPARDLALLGLAVVLGGLVLPAAGLLPGRLLPTAAGGYAELGLAVSGLVLLAVAVTGPALRTLGLLLVALPFVLFGALESGAGLPPAAWLVLPTAALVVGRLGASRRVALIAVVGGLVVFTVLGGADAGLLGDVPHPLLPDAPSAQMSPADLARQVPKGIRAGAPIPPPDGRVPALGEGTGPWWVEAVVGTHPGPRPVVLVLGGRLPKSAARALGSATLISGDALAFSHAHELRGFDAVVVRENAWAVDDARSQAKARAVAGFVRKGGLLIGPAPARPWPASLGPALRNAARSPTAGLLGLRRAGLGRVVRAAHLADIAETIAADLWVRDVGTPLLDPAARPAPLAGWDAWRDDPRSRRTQGWLLMLFVVAVAASTWLLRSGLPQVLGTLLAAAAVAAGLVWTSTDDPGFRAHAVVLDLGGAGGRRIEAVWISAGPQGYRGRVRFVGGGVVGLRGGALDADGRVVIQPRHSAWVVRETEGRGVLPEDVEDRQAGAALRLLEGTVDLRQVRLGRLPRLPVLVEGWGALAATSVVLRAPR